ncbi:hypothetical protein D0T53_13450 [Dysgonomonas sp. 216]|uniref:hypothetical protein n=1 Tax=Dysgonomonas sp. 216 TaxID=2302934 RepID=UPI0013D3C5D0|nr:hypothetical protein [Dysgonomonas sp. 216]NDW19899.1 hypothetical protein [Dysgonomonas sp. 216]
MEWKDVELYIGGQKIVGVAECSFFIEENDSERTFPKLEFVSLSGNVKFTSKQMCEFRKFLKGHKKIRLPRKMKKRLKKQRQKQFEAWCKHYFPFTPPPSLGMFGCVVGSEKPKFHYNSSIFGKRMVK